MSAPLVEVRELVKEYPRRGFAGRAGAPVRAVDRVSLELRRGETLALVGESGCGKTTLARCVVGLLEPTSGQVRYDGTTVGSLEGDALRAFRRRAQIVFQDPFGSLNPRMRVGAAIGEALRAHRLAGDREGRLRRVSELLHLVGLDPATAGRFPHELSAGQRQRVAIGRALSVEPELVVLDEPVSSLDVSVRAHVLGLLDDLQARLGLTYLLVAHDLAMVERVSDRVAVMHRGEIVETAPTVEVYRAPRHPWTRELLDAIPGARRRSGREAPPEA